MKNKPAAFAIYKNRSEIRTAIRSLLRLGFKDSSLAVMQPVKGGAQDFPQVQKNQIATGARVGAFLGAFIAGGLYLFIGPGLDSHAVVMNAAVWLGTLVAIVAVVLGGIAGAACGALVGIGTPKPMGRRYGQYLHSGGILLSVESETPEQAARAESVLLATGGQDVHIGNEKTTWNEALVENYEMAHEKSKNRLQTNT